MTTPLERVPRISPGFRLQWEEAQSVYVILYPEGMVRLNPSAAETLKRCDGERSLSEIIQDLERQFPGVALAADVERFLETAHGNGWVRW
jgi:pyrroloquinoline quinone biosynthesis protein D